MVDSIDHLVLSKIYDRIVKTDRFGCKVDLSDVIPKNYGALLKLIHRVFTVYIPSFERS